jgi:hypothetical protein
MYVQQVIEIISLHPNVDSKLGYTKFAKLRIHSNDPKQAEL